MPLNLKPHWGKEFPGSGNRVWKFSGEAISLVVAAGKSPIGSVEEDGRSEMMPMGKETHQSTLLCVC